MKILDIMLDLEFLGTEEDMAKFFPGEDAFPVVTSIGIAAQANGNLIQVKEIPLNFTEQLDNGAKFGKDCMVEFWTKQPLLGAELSKSIQQSVPVQFSLMKLAESIGQLRKQYPDYELNVWGNNLIADNAKVIRLFSKYSYNPIPWSYWENSDYRQFINTAEYLGFSKEEANKTFEAEVIMGKYAQLGIKEVAPHNAAYDCVKQLSILNDARSYLAYVKENI